MTVGGLAQLGERLICIQEVSGSIPLSSTKVNAGVAQLVEQAICNRQVGSSNLSAGTTTQGDLCQV